MEELERFMSVLGEADTLVCESQGTKTGAFKTKEVYKSIKELYVRANSHMVRNVDRSGAVWFGKCPNCGKMIVKTEEIQVCSNTSCRAHVIWE